MEMTEEYYNSMSAEDRAEYDAKVKKLNEVYVSDSPIHNPKSAWRTGKRSKKPRNVASRKPVKR